MKATDARKQALANHKLRIKEEYEYTKTRIQEAVDEGKFVLVVDELYGEVCDKLEKEGYDTYNSTRQINTIIKW